MDTVMETDQEVARSAGHYLTNTMLLETLSYNVVHNNCSCRSPRLSCQQRDFVIITGILQITHEHSGISQIKCRQLVP